MAADYYSLLARYVGHHVCLTLHGQTNVWGRVAGVCYDGVRLVDTIVSGDLDSGGPFSSNPAGPQPPPGARSHETLIHVNQVLAVTCLDEDLPDAPSDRETRQNHAGLLVDPIELWLGSALRLLAERPTNRRQSLQDQVNLLRNRMAKDLGLWLPEIRIRETSDLAPYAYTVKLRGVTAITAELPADKLLALETSTPTKLICDSPPVETPCGLPGVWIEPRQQELAEMYGYSVLPPPAVVVAHLDALFRDRAPQMFGRQQLEDLLDQVRAVSPALVEEVLPELIRPRQLLKILRNLLSEGVPVRDMDTILESLPEAIHDTTDPTELTERVRHALAHSLTERYRDSSGTLHAVTFDPTLEASLTRVVRHSSSKGRQLQLSAVQCESLLSSLSTRLAEMRAKGCPEVVLTTTPLRAPLRALTATRLPKCVILSHEEIAPTARVSSIGMIFYSALFNGL